MYISRLEISNFKKATSNNPIIIELKNGLNLLIGENNIGKTTIVEALVICLNYGSSDKNVWLSEADFHDPTKPISIGIEFSGLNDAQQAAFLEALILDGEHGKHKLRFDFNFNLRGTKIQPQVKCGETGDTTNPYDILAYLRAIFLPALRDVSSEFKPGYRSRVGNILKKNLDDEGVEFESIFQKANREALALQGDENPVLKLEKNTNPNIDKLTLRGDDNKIKLNFVDQEFTKILSNIRMTCAAKGLDISTNGLGYNNLIFISTVLTELKYDEVLTPHKFSCLIIEEPEAHLHPQLQSLLLEFLQNEYKDIQVILTSHSPTLASVVDLNNINILCRNADNVKSLLLQNASIQESNKLFLQLFLDVTKSQLFFARSIIFVEGITEAILLKSFWDYMYRDPNDSFEKQGIEIVNIQGVSFSRYIDLVSNVFSESNVKSVIITDDDRGTGRDCPNDMRFTRDGNLRDTSEIISIFDSAPISARAAGLKSEVDTLRAQNKRIALFMARKTLEVELGMANMVFRHRLGQLLDTTFDTTSDKELGIEVWKCVVSSSSKSDFADKLVAVIQEDIKNIRFSLAVPKYIRDAFEYITND
nr:AAA family ATPase [candidate division Zixibacteria bacterium]